MSGSPGTPFADSATPAPLVPDDLDLRDFPHMLLDVGRLRDSDLAGAENPEVFRCGVLSWCVAWHQVPAASLPDDDVRLARLLGFGRDVQAWAAVRAAGGLHGWVRCSDGRLYHPVVAEKALEAWAAKQSQRARTRAATKARLQSPSDSEEPSEQPSNRHVARDVARDVDRHDARNVHQGKLSKGKVSKGKEEDVCGLAQSANPPHSPPVGGNPHPGLFPDAPPPTPPPFDGENAEALNGRAIVALADGFELPEQWGLDAEALGFKPGDVLREGERFRQYWTAGRGAGTRRSVKGWRQSWSTWLDKAAKEVHR